MNDCPASTKRSYKSAALLFAGVNYRNLNFHFETGSWIGTARAEQVTSFRLPDSGADLSLAKAPK